MKNTQGVNLIIIYVLGWGLGVLSVAATVPHPDDPSKSREHLALLALATESSATHPVFQSGDWSAAETWDDPTTPEEVEPAPGDGGKVLVPAGVTLTVDSVIPARLMWIRVNGTLRFSPGADTELNVESIIVDPNGIYEQGTFDDPVLETQGLPIPSSVKSVVRFIDTGEIDRVYDPFGLSRGLISHGVASIHGASATPYVFLAEPAMAGEAVIHLAAEPVNWELGERIVVPAVDYMTRFPEGMSQADLDELFTIEAIDFNSETGQWDVSLNRPLAFDHLPPTRDDGDGHPVPAFAVPVAYLHRNIIYTSENPATSRRGHVMFMHNAGVSVANALFEELGRTAAQTEVTDPQVDASNILDVETTGNDRGRYAFHLHRTIPDSGRKVKVSGICVIGSPKLGIVNHDSYVDVEDSVVFDAAGSAFFTEIGTELGSFQRCLAIHTLRGTGELEDRFRHLLLDGADFGFNGVGFWLQGGGVSVTDCMAFNSRREGFVAETVSLIIDGKPTRFPASNLEDPEWVVDSKLYYAPGNEGFVNIDEVALRQFERNLSVASVTGMIIRKHNPIGRPTEVKDFQVYNVSARGIGADYGGPTTFKNVILRGGTKPYPGTDPWRSGNAWKGVSMNGSNLGFVFENVEITRFEVGLHYVNNWGGYYNFIRDSHFDNILNIEAFESPEAQAAVYIENVTFSYTTPLLNDPANPRFNAYHDLVLTAFPGRPNSQVWWSPPGDAGSATTTLFQFPAHGSASFPLSESLPPSSPILELFVSRKPHGTTGEIDLYLPVIGSSVTGAPGGVESRDGGVENSHQLILTFDRLLAEGSVQITSGNPEITVTPEIRENQVILNLSGVADGQWVEFTLAGLTDGQGNVLEQPQSGVALTPSPNRIVGFFRGDTSADGILNDADLAPAQIRSGPVNSQTFRADLNGDGVVSFADVTSIAAAVGHPVGAPELLRYALGLDLTSKSDEGLPTATIEGTDLTLSYTRPAGATDISYQPWWSDNLDTWSMEGIETEVSTDEDNVQHVKARIPLDGATQKYMRLEVGTL